MIKDSLMVKNNWKNKVKVLKLGKQ